MSRMNRSVLPCLMLLLVSAIIVNAEEPLPFPNMAPTIGRYIERYYYDHQRIRPRNIVERALQGLEQAESVILAQWSDDDLLLRIGDDRHHIPATEPTDIGQAMTILEKVRAILPQHFDAQRSRDLSYTMLNHALRTLDPHTLIYPPIPASEFEEEIQGEFQGIGAWLNEEDGVIRIERVMPGLPADQAGILDGDIILQIDHERTVGLSLRQAVTRIRGPEGTTVVLHMERDDGVHEIPVVRGRITSPVLQSYRHGDIGYVRMDEFNRQTATALRMAVVNLLIEQRRPLAGFILDLRFNTGGLLNQAEENTDFFLPAGKEIVRTVATGRRDRVQLSGRDVILDVPMAVLIGPSSASASEIMAGALQRNERAVVIGRNSFGKGTVQNIHRLRDDSRLKFTIQEYLLTGRVSIQENGVVPDIELLRHTQAKDGSIDLVPYTLRREGDDEFALPGHGTYHHASRFRLPWLQQYRTREENRRHLLSSPEFSPDQEAMVAVELMAEVFAGEDRETIQAGARRALDEDRMRLFILDHMEAAIERRLRKENQQLTDALAALDPPIDWGGDLIEGDIDGARLSLRFDGPQRVAAGDEVSLAFTLDNDGDDDLGRLYALIAADHGSPFWEQEIIFGRVRAGSSVTRSLDITVPPRSFGSDERFSLRLFRGEETEPVLSLPVVLNITGGPRPVLALAYQLKADDDEDALQSINHDEPVVLSVRVANVGEAATAPATLFVFKNDDPFTDLGEGRFRIGALSPGQEVECLVPITVRRTITVNDRERERPSGPLELHLHVREEFPEGVDGRYATALFHRLNIPLDEPVSLRSVIQPRIDIESVERAEPDAEAVRFAIRILDEHLRYVSLFHDRDKVLLKSRSDLNNGLLDTVQPLGPGLNTFRIVAINHDDVERQAVIRVWGSDDQEVTVKREAAAVEDVP